MHVCYFSSDDLRATLRSFLFLHVMVKSKRSLIFLPELPQLFCVRVVSDGPERVLLLAGIALHTK